MHQILFRLRLRPDPAGGAHSCILGCPTSKGKEGREKGEDTEREGRGKKGK